MPENEPEQSEWSLFINRLLFILMIAAFIAILFYGCICTIKSNKSLNCDCDCHSDDRYEEDRGRYIDTKGYW